MVSIKRQWGRRALVAAVLGIHAALLAWLAVDWSPTFDEPAHLMAGIRFWQTGHSDLDQGNPPLPRAVAALPVLLTKPAVDWGRVPATFACRDDFVAVNGSRLFWMVTLGRWACIPFSLLGALVCYCWARRWYGDGAGITALLLWCFSPNMLANGMLITGDVAAASLGALACYAFWRWLDAPDWSKAAGAGVCLGLAELSKFVCLLFVPLWPLIWIAWHIVHRHQLGRPGWFRQSAQLLLMGVACVWVINLGYGTDNCVDRFHQPPSWPAPAGSPATTMLQTLPLPLPQAYVEGIARVHERTHSGLGTYLRGEFRVGGWWCYYLYAFLVKEPAGTILLMALATVLAVASPRYRTDRPREALLLLLLAAVLGFVSALGVVQKLRYVLPAFPFLFIWAGRSGRAWQNRHRWLALVSGGCLLWSVASSLAVYPHSFSYFNEFTGGPTAGHWHLIDSNIDWGQDLGHLKKWLDAHPEATPFHLAYFGSIDPLWAGIDYRLPPLDRPRPGWHAISVQLLRIPERATFNGRGGQRPVGAVRYEYFWNLTPVAMAGKSIYIYHVEEGAERNAP